jgi:hypothetical protein
MAYGEPRSTRDIDIVVGLRPKDIARLRQHFPAPDFYFDEAKARSIARDGGLFNIIHPASGLKLDLYVPQDEIEQRQLEHARLLRALSDRDALFSPPEELILKKLQFCALGGSDKHLRNVAAMLQVSCTLPCGRGCEIPLDPPLILLANCSSVEPPALAVTLNRGACRSSTTLPGLIGSGVHAHFFRPCGRVPEPEEFGFYMVFHGRPKRSGRVVLGDWNPVHARCSVREAGFMPL